MSNVNEQSEVLWAVIEDDWDNIAMCFKYQDNIYIVPAFFNPTFGESAAQSIWRDIQNGATGQTLEEYLADDAAFEDGEEPGWKVLT